MFPCLPFDYLRNHRIADVVLPAELSIDTVNWHPLFANLSDIIFGQLGRSIQLSSVVTSPAAMFSVSSVIGPRSRPKMGRITASRVVARMQNKWHVIRNGAVGKNVDEPVGKNRLTTLAPETNSGSAISSLIARSLIRPASEASATVVDMAQYQLNLLWGKLMAHCTVLSCSVTPSAVSAARGFSPGNYTTSGGTV